MRKNTNSLYPEPEAEVEMPEPTPGYPPICGTDNEPERDDPSEDVRLFRPRLRLISED